MKLLPLILLTLLYNCSHTPNSRCPVNRNHPKFVQTAQKNFCEIVQPKLVSCVNKDKKITAQAGSINIAINYKVNGDGKLKSVSISDNKKIGRKLKACLTKQAAKQKFEANPDEGEYHLDFLFNFAIEKR